MVPNPQLWVRPVGRRDEPAEPTYAKPIAAIGTLDSGTENVPTRIGGGKYTLVEPIGHGGMAEVWKGKDERTGKALAVKLLAPSRNARGRRHGSCPRPGSWAPCATRTSC